MSGVEGAVGLAVGITVLLVFIVDRIAGPSHRRMKDLADFLKDWKGAPERRTDDKAKILEERRPGVLERMHTHEEDIAAAKDDIAAIKDMLNGGGLGSQLRTLTETLSHHMQLSEADRQGLHADIRETRVFVADGVTQIATGLQRAEEKVDDVKAQVDDVKAQVEELDEKVGGRLFTLEEAERAHRAALHEYGFDLDDS